MSENKNPWGYRRSPDLFWPIILIGVGVILLLSNLGYLPANPWPVLWRLWPVILIVIGIDILFGRGSMWGSVIGAVMALLLVGGVIAVLFLAPSLAASLPGVFGPGGPFVMTNADLKTAKIAHPAGDISSASVTLDLSSAHTTVSAATDSANLIEGEMTYYGDLVDEFSASGSRATVRVGTRFDGGMIGFMDSGRLRWDLRLGAGPMLDLSVDGGSGSSVLNLARLKLNSLDIDGGAGSISVTLPDSGGYRFRLNGGSGSIEVRIPENVAVRVDSRAGSGSINLPGRIARVSGSGRNGTFETAGFARTGAWVEITINGGAGSINVR